MKARIFLIAILLLLATANVARADVPEADLRIDLKPQYMGEGLYLFRVFISNSGPDDAQSIIIKFYTVSNNQVTQNLLPELMANQMAEFQLPITITEATILYAGLYGDYSDPNTIDNFRQLQLYEYPAAQLIPIVFNR